MKHLLFILAGILFSATSISQTVEFGHTGTAQPFTIPNDVTEISVEMYGAGGGFGAWEEILMLDKYTPGNGGKLTANYKVTPGETIYIYVGGKGADATAHREGSGGFNGGGNGNNTGTYGPYCGGGGGGASDIRIGGQDLAHRVLIVGGGGGSGSNYPDGGDHGGQGGDEAGTNGMAENKTGHESCGHGATQKKGGLGGQWNGYLKGQDGSLGMGGHAPDSTAGGGGGGGYYGGGAGCWSGGGGGSSFAAPLAKDVEHEQGVNFGDGKVIISFIHSEVVVQDVEDTLQIELVEIVEIIDLEAEKVISNEEIPLVEKIETVQDTDTKSTDILDAEKPKYLIYPNPTDGLLVIEGDNVHAVDIFNLNGKLVFSSSYKKRLDVSELPAGTYLVHIKDQEKNLLSMEKLIIQ